MRTGEMKGIFLIGVICSIHSHLLSLVESLDCETIDQCSSFKCPKYQKPFCSKIDRECKCYGKQQNRGEECGQTSDCKKGSCNHWVVECENNKCVCVEPDKPTRTCTTYSQCNLCSNGRIRQCIDGDCECKQLKKVGEPCNIQGDCATCTGTDIHQCVDKKGGGGKVCKCEKNKANGDQHFCDNDDFCTNKFCNDGKTGECYYSGVGYRRCYCYPKGCLKAVECNSSVECQKCCYGSSVDKSTTQHQSYCNSVPQG